MSGKYKKVKCKKSDKPQTLNFYQPTEIDKQKTTIIFLIGNRHFLKKTVDSTGFYLLIAKSPAYRTVVLTKLVDQQVL